MDEQMTPIEQTDITFADILKTIKGGWKRILIFVIIAVFIATTALVLANELTKSTEYESVVYYSGNFVMEKKWKTTQELSSVIKSDYLIRETLTALNYTDAQKDELFELKIQDHIQVVVRDEIMDAEKNKYPYAVAIKLVNVKELGFSQDQANDFLITLINKSTNHFVPEQAVLISFEKSGIDLKTDNYLHAIDRYTTLYNQINTAITSSPTALQNFMSLEYEKSLTAIKAQATNTLVGLGQLYTFITDNTAKNGANGVVVSEANYIKTKRDGLEIEIKNLEKYLEEYLQLLQDTKPTININGTASPDSASAYYAGFNKYHELQNTLMGKRNELAKLDVILANYETKPAASADVCEDIETQLKTIEEQYAEMVTQLNTIKTEYAKEKVNNSISQVSAAERINTKKISKLIFIAVEGIVAVCAFLVAYMITSKKIKESEQSK